MKKYLNLIAVIIIAFTISAKAGQEGGGGGHPCKENFMRVFIEVKSLANENPMLNKTHPFLHQILNVLNPDKIDRNRDSAVQIEVLEKPIENCPLTENPIACGRPKQKKIELFCGDGGWMSLGYEQKVKHVIHELLWWVPRYNDANYDYSSSLVRDLMPILKTKQRQVAATLKPANSVDLQMKSQAGAFSTPPIFAVRFECTTNQFGNNPTEQIIANSDPDLFKKTFSTERNIVSGSIGINKEITLSAPAQELNFYSKCKVQLNLYYKLENQGFGSVIEIARTETDNYFNKDLTKEFITAIAGAYKLTPQIDSDGKTCYVLLSKWENGTWMAKSKDFYFSCTSKKN